MLLGFGLMWFWLGESNELARLDDEGGLAEEASEPAAGSGGGISAPLVEDPQGGSSE